MRTRSKALVNLSVSLFSEKRHPISKFKFLPPPTCSFLLSKPLSTANNNVNTNVEEAKTQVKSERDGYILENFRNRAFKGSSKTPDAETQKSAKTVSSSCSTDKVSEHGLKNTDGQATNVVVSFKDLGLRKELTEALEEMCVIVPSEIQCVGIPAVLEGKSVLMTSECGSDRTLAYLLPFIQLLKWDEGLTSKAECPRAIVLCATEEQSEQCFNIAQCVLHKSSGKSGNEDTSGKDSSNVPVGLLIGTPSEIINYINEGSLSLDEIKYMAFDEVDFMLESGLGPEISKVVTQLKEKLSKSSAEGLHTVFVTSSISKLLGDQSPLVKQLEQKHAGSISAMMLEIDHTEVFHLIESANGLKNKVAEAMGSLLQQEFAVDVDR